MEQRKHERFKMNIPARILVTTSRGKKEYLRLDTYNICAGGAYFETDQIIHDMTRVDMDFVLPINQFKNITGTDGYVEISGIVLRRDARGMARCFNTDYEIFPFRTNKSVRCGIISLKKHLFENNINAGELKSKDQIYE